MFDWLIMRSVLYNEGVWGKYIYPPRTYRLDFNHRRQR